jgi:hypothetical protein
MITSGIAEEYIRISDEYYKRESTPKKVVRSGSTEVYVPATYLKSANAWEKTSRRLADFLGVSYLRKKNPRRIDNCSLMIETDGSTGLSTGTTVARWIIITFSTTFDSLFFLRKLLTKLLHVPVNLNNTISYQSFSLYNVSIHLKISLSNIF